MRLHIEATDSPDDYTLYSIAVNGTAFNIIAKQSANASTFLNVNKGNINYLKGYGNAEGGVDLGGIVGLWTEGSGNGLWNLELLSPTITVSNGTFTLTYPIEDNTVEIRYTTDGSTPTKSSTLYEDPFVTDPETTQVKVTAFKKSIANIQSATVTYNLPKLPIPTYDIDQAESKFILNHSIAGSTIRYTIDETPPTATTGTEYSAPFTVSSGTTVKAIAVKNGYTQSDVMTHQVNKVATPVFTNTGRSLIITCPTNGATIHYTTDGNDPTGESTVYSIPLTDVSGKTVKAIATQTGSFDSEMASSGTIVFTCENPVIRREPNDKFSISCGFPATSITIHYTTNGSDPTEGSPVYNEPVTISGYPITIKAKAYASNYNPSSITTKTIGSDMDVDGTTYIIASAGDFDLFVQKVNAGNTSLNFKVTDDFTVGISSPITQPYEGIFDGNGYTISGLDHPLFNTVDGGVVKNVTLTNVSINSSADYVGAIAGIAQGYSRIYNCGILPNSADFPEGTHPSVTTTGECAGGIVGKLDGDSRVINCYSYADVSASTTAAGIVGQNTYASTAAVSGDKYTKLRTAVVNCLFYGDILGGTNQYGVYGGELISNAAATGISSYNYFRSGSKFTAANGNPNTNGGAYVVGNPTAYNCSFPAEERYLTQVEFHRSLLNSNRELCGWWVGSDVAPNTLTTTEVQAIPKDASLMYKWVVDPSVAPYPILKPFGKYASVINGNTGTPWVNRATANPYEGKQLGTLTVTVNSGSHSSVAPRVLSIPITDMDTLHYDFGYRKIQLPYYNTVFGNPEANTWEEKYANNYTDQVVTGWIITAVTGGTPGTFDNSSERAWENGYNFADRKCTNKDKYDVSGRVFAQGGNYYVPDGVTAITIEAYWGKAIYVRNAGASYDRVNITKGGSGAYSNGAHFAPAGTRDNNINGATIQTASTKGSIRDALTATNIDAKKTVYDYALVLVGNVQESVGKNDVVHATENTRGFTIMSVDLDFDEEPDYCLEWQLGDNMTRQVIAPIRFDFLPVVELGIAGKLHNSTYFLSLGCYRSKGHLEVTETAFIRFGQFEFELGTRDEGPIILNGGIYDQYCRGRNGEETQNINYVILGGHVVMPSFTPGAHVNSGTPYKTRHCAVNVLGGNFTSFYLTGGYNEGVEPFEDNPHCYIDGGRFGTIAAAYKEGIWGDVTWRINHALIREFYGGGVMSQTTGNNYKIVKGNINVVIDNSIVGKYCGGPKFGDMVSGKTVTTSATGTIFNQYFGAGNGGTNYVQYKSTDATGTPISDWSSTINSWYHPKQYRNTAQGYEADYDIEVINYSTGDGAGKVVNRSYYYSAQFATTNTGDVTSTLTDCTVNTNFYGGGFLGGVTGSVTSTLNNCTVKGSVFGAGYSASSGTVSISNKDKVPPVPNIYTGIIKPQTEGTATTYYWTHETTFGSTTLSTSSPAVLDPNGDGKNYFYTEIPLNDLGTVSGIVTLNINGTTTVGESVYGGGEESNVSSNTEVNISNGTVQGNVFGGGKGKADTFTCEKAMVGIDGDGVANPAGGTTVTISNGTVNGNVYGGGEVGRVEKNTVVTVGVTEGESAPIIKGNVFGAGAGKETHGYSALVRGNPTVIIQGNAKVWHNVYGGGEIASVARYKVKQSANDPDAPPGWPIGMPYALANDNSGNCTVTIQGNAVIGKDDIDDTGHVFGAGKGLDPYAKTYTYEDDEHKPYRMINDNSWEYFADESAYLTFIETLALASKTNVTIGGDASIKGSVYGGSESGFVQYDTQITIQENCEIGNNVYGGGKGLASFAEGGRTSRNTTVTILGGSIANDVYGGAALAKVNTASTTTTGADPITTYPTSTVNLFGGAIAGDAYGGGQGDKASLGLGHSDVAADAGNTKVNLNGLSKADYTSAFSTILTLIDGNGDGDTDDSEDYYMVNTGRKGCSVTQVFGCNNTNGSPKGDVTVHVFGTQNKHESKTTIAAKISQAEIDAASEEDKPLLNALRYDVAAVYGGGDMAAYAPTLPYHPETAPAGSRSHVIIDGCDYTSIENVYGGGNAAPVPETNLRVNSDYEIDYLFGGGNGAGVGNPGADIGIIDPTAYSSDPENGTYGTGIANVELYGGTIHTVFGGSNTKGNVRGGTNMLTADTDPVCELEITNIYGAGQNAEQDGGVNLILGCVKGIENIYGGARNAHIKGGVYLTITSGSFQNVFGGNNEAGTIRGPIRLNIEETACDPIIINNLYLGGNLASYSVYGYYNAGTALDPDYQPRTSLSDHPETAVGTPVTPFSETQWYADPELNVISCTRIDNVFGGGLGEPAVMYGNPSVNINMIPGDHAALIDRDGTPGADGDATALGEIGYVYGGGNEADVKGSTTVNIGTEDTVTLVSTGATEDVTGAYVTGNVFGGGKGIADSFTCAKAMVNSASVNIGNGTVKGTVYGGGQIGRVEEDTRVTIGLESGTSEPVIEGSVYGAGKGVTTHGYAALVRGNAYVTVQGDAKIGNSVYGGGQISSVGKYNVAQNQAEADEHGVEIGMPYSLVYENKGICTVIVRGNAEIGPDNMQMTKVGGPDDTGYVFGAGKGVLPYEGYGDEETPWRRTNDEEHPQQYYTTDKEDDYLKFIETLALTTRTIVTIGGNAFIKGSVYGGSENGHVQYDTDVTIEGDCQIGNGHVLLRNSENEIIVSRSLNRRYTSDEWAQGKLIGDADWTSESLPECASWEYKSPYKPYDKYVDNDEASTTATDGHTFYGNVFGGGSGLYPYWSRRDSKYEWLPSAGRIVGETKVTITGGHILTSVYGGCELTDVTDKCTIKMSGGTLGVPRTLDQIAAHPVSCYLFGAGKGDERTYFNTWTNVGSVDVEISGNARIYGSVFGGGEDGHVLGNVDMAIKENAYIGTWGTSYVDGNVFGGGRGFGGGALTAGVVSGNVGIDISGGTMLGSVYGGGRLGSVGTYLVPPDHANYGKLIPDGKEQVIGGADIDAEKTHGHVTIDISGGTIGNNHEYVYNPSNELKTGTLRLTEFGEDNRLKHTKGGNVFAGSMGRFYALDNTTVLPHWLDLGKVKSTKLTISGSARIKSNVYGGGELGWVSGTHRSADDTQDVSTEIIMTGGTIGTEIQDGETTKYTFGSIFGGGYGSSIEKLIYIDPITGDPVETNPKFTAGRVKYSTKIDMLDGTVLASVYGGGEVANVGMGSSYGEDGSEDVNVSANVTVSGGTIGKDRVVSGENVTYFGGATMGNVYGGGSGNKTIVRCGAIYGNTNVHISQAEGKTTRIYHNVYGGGALGTVGDFDYRSEYIDEFGTVKAYEVTGLHTAGTGVATVTITGGTIGTDGRENGMVFGSSRGEVEGEYPRDDYMSWVYDAHVTIGEANKPGPQIYGSVYGSGENGHTFHDTEVSIHSGTVGINSGMPITSNGRTYTGAEYPSRGNVYGGGCGTDTYSKVVESKTLTYYNPMAGIVYGNTTVNIDGGHVVRTVYGGGSMGSVGKFTHADAAYHAEHPDVPIGKPYACAEGTGICRVTISGGQIGPETMVMPNTYGNVFGAGRGETHDPEVYVNLETSGYFNETEVTIKDTAFVKGSVYGGSESGHVLGDTWVKIQGGQIGCGKNTTEPYTDESKWIPNADPADFAECVSWPYEPPYAPYDKFADADGNYPAGAAHENADQGRNTGSDGHTFYGNVFGGGSGYEPYAPGRWLNTAGWVEGNTKVEITGGHILTSVYGGCEMTNVGHGVNGTGGKTTMKMSGGTLGVPRTLEQITAHPVTCYFFGAGKGDQRIFFNKETNIKETEIEISGGIIYGSVFGGGEDGHVLRDVNMTIKENEDPTKSPWIGTWGTSYVEGNVFGGGRGFSGEALTAGNVGGSVTMNISGGTMLGSIYGGGRLGSVGYGLYLVDEEVGGVKPYGVMRPDNVDDRGNAVADFNRGYITINISGGTIGNDNEYIYNPSAEEKAAIPNTTFDFNNRLTYTKGGNVFTGCMGRLYALDGTLLPLWPKLGRCKQTVLNISGGWIKSNVYGGAELGVVDQNTTVNITGGTVGTKVVDPDNAANYYYYGTVFGGGKGSVDEITYPVGTPEGDKTDIGEAGTVHGNVAVNLNKDVANNTKGGIVNKIFGCNDMNGTPKGNVTVHVYKTQNAAAAQISTKTEGDYDVAAVYGGGNMAAYEPTAADDRTEVIIDGCELTSIQTVYGGGNAASAPATHVTINGTYEINELFGGGNGKDRLPNGDPNPGANVGYHAYPDAENHAYATKEDRVANYSYGLGKTHVEINGGTVHAVYGGSNTKGNIRVEARVSLEDLENCDFNVGDAYGGGKSAAMDGDAVLEMRCIPGLKTVYGGAMNADINGNIILNITNGSYEQVFGGNNVGGRVTGAIQVNIEETGCRPIIIGELYGGGNRAPYSIYGYTEKRDAENNIVVDEDGKTVWVALETGTMAQAEDPQINVKSFTSIGSIYGGGYGETAVMAANPHVNINVVEHSGTAAQTRTAKNDPTKYLADYEGADRIIDGNHVVNPPHVKDKMGVINNVFGGGNAAKVVGNPHVNVCTESTVDYVTKFAGEADPRTGLTVKGADIRGNIYGGGNMAEVKGNTNVTIGRE
jgi:hypothetical protein